MRSAIWGVRSSLRSDQNENILNLSFWYEIRHLGGQIEHRRSRSTWKSINFHPNIPIVSFEMKSGIQGVRSSVGSDQCAKIFVWNPLPAVQSSVWQRHSWHGLLLVAPYLNKGNHDVVVIDRGSPPWSPWGPRSGRPHELSRPPPFFKGVLHNLLLPSSTSVWNQRSPLIQCHRFMNTCTECSVSL